MNQKNSLGLDKCFLDVDDPVDLFKHWFNEAKKTELNDPNALSLATSDAKGFPSVRVVLLKDFSQNGFVFYTNLNSKKSLSIKENPRAEMCFYWKSLSRQIRINGTILQVSDKEADNYYFTRPYGSKLAAWASKQSKTLSERVELEARVHDYRKKFADDDIPLPPFWGGYRLNPEQIEFWQGRTDRLHDRVLFKKWPDGWQGESLYP